MDVGDRALPGASAEQLPGRWEIRKVDCVLA